MIVTANGDRIKLEGDEQTMSHLTNPKGYAQFIIHQINTERIYDRWLKDKKDMVILDIGANVGLYTVYAQDAAKRIVAVEPTPAHNHVFNQLTANFKNVELVKAALSSTNEPVKFYISSENSTTNSLVYKSKDFIEAPGITFTSLLDTYKLDHVDFAKIDIEGGEMIILDVDTLKSIYDRVDVLFIETHCITEPWSMEKVTVARDEMAERVKASGYSAEIIDFATVLAYKEKEVTKE